MNLSTRLKSTLLAIATLPGWLQAIAQQQAKPDTRTISEVPASALFKPGANGLPNLMNAGRYSAATRNTPGTGTRMLTTPFQFPLTDCYTYTYQLKTGLANINTFIKGTVTTANGETYTVGYTTDAAGNTSGMIQQLDRTGGIGFTKTFALASKKLVLNSIRQLPNGNLVVIGTYTDPTIVGSRLLLASLDGDGVLLWCKSLNYAGFEGIAVCSDLVNGIGFCGHNNQYALYGRLDNAGNLVWLQQLSLGDYGNVVGMDNESFYNWYVACNSFQAGKHTGLLLSINPVNGVLQ